MTVNIQTNLLKGIMSITEKYDNNKIGVMLSGGPDSAILYYLLVKENKQYTAFGDGFEIVPLCCPKADGADHYAELINEAVCSKLGVVKPNIFYVGNPWQEHDKIVTGAIINSLQYAVSRVFVADNITPPVEFSGLKPERVRSGWVEVIQPFFDMTKEKILKLFYDFGVEDLLVITHTCTETPRGRCNACWQCHERIWAFDQLKKQDPGSE